LPVVKDEKKESEIIEKESDKSVAKENGDAEEIVNGNGTIDSPPNGVSEENASKCEILATDTTATLEASSEEIQKDKDAEEQVESKLSETVSNDDTTTNIVESINDAMKETIDVNPESNTDTEIKEDCSNLQEKDVLVEEIVLENTSIEPVEQETDNDVILSTSLHTHVVSTHVENSSEVEKVVEEQMTEEVPETKVGEQEETIEISGTIELENDTSIKSDDINELDSSQENSEDKQIQSEEIATDISNEKPKPPNEEIEAISKESDNDVILSTSLHAHVVSSHVENSDEVEEIVEEKIVEEESEVNQENDSNENTPDDLKEEESAAEEKPECADNIAASLSDNDKQDIADDVTTPPSISEETKTNDEEIEVSGSIEIESSESIVTEEENVAGNDAKVELETSTNEEEDVQLSQVPDKIISEEKLMSQDEPVQPEAVKENSEENESVSKVEPESNINEDCTENKESESKEFSTEHLKEEKETCDEPLDVVPEVIPCEKEIEKTDEVKVETLTIDLPNSELISSKEESEEKPEIMIDIEKEEKGVEVVGHDWDMAGEVVQSNLEEDEEQCIGSPVTRSPAFMTEVLSSSDEDDRELVKEPEPQVLTEEVKIENISETLQQSPQEVIEDVVHETNIDETVANKPETYVHKDMHTREENDATTETVVLERKEESIPSPSALRSTEPIKTSKEPSKKTEDNSNVVVVVAAVLAIAIGMILYHMFNKK